MEERRWCLRVARTCGEEERKRLISEGLLDRSCKIRGDGDHLLIPVIREIPGAVCELVECLSEKPDLPRFEQIGGIAVMQEDDPPGAALILADRPCLHTVLYAESAVSGPFRTKQYKVLAGVETTSTDYTEYGHHFAIDLELAYFSARLSGERQRIEGLVTPGERIVDMFAGVGPFAITLARKAGIVYAGDINPDAVLLMIKNIHKNHIENIIPLLADATDLPDIITQPADRVIMNLPLNAESFLTSAFRLCRPGGVIHLYALVSCEDELVDLVNQYPVQEVCIKFVRSYSPDKFHVVYDIIRGDGVKD